MFPKTRRSRTTLGLTPPESRVASTRRAPSTLGEVRRDLLQCARGDPLQEQRSCRVSEADRDASEARADFWSLSGEFIYRRHHSQFDEFYAQFPPLS